MECLLAANWTRLLFSQTLALWSNPFLCVTFSSCYWGTPSVFFETLWQCKICFPDLVVPAQPGSVSALQQCWDLSETSALLSLCGVLQFRSTSNLVNWGKYGGCGWSSYSSEPGVCSQLLPPKTHTCGRTGAGMLPTRFVPCSQLSFCWVSSELQNSCFFCSVFICSDLQLWLMGAVLWSLLIYVICWPFLWHSWIFLLLSWWMKISVKLFTPGEAAVGKGSLCSGGCLVLHTAAALGISDVGLLYSNSSFFVHQ